jgi:hypothetical protein
MCCCPIIFERRNLVDVGGLRLRAVASPYFLFGFDLKESVVRLIVRRFPGGVRIDLVTLSGKAGGFARWFSEIFSPSEPSHSHPGRRRFLRR